MFISSGPMKSTAGLLENAVVPAIKNYYDKNINFKKFIDDLSPEDFSQIMDFISKKMKEHTNEKIDLDRFKPLFDIDFCVTIQDMLQPPLRQSFPENFIFYNIFMVCNYFRLCEKYKNRKVYSKCKYYY